MASSETDVITLDSDEDGDDASSSGFRHQEQPLHPQHPQPEPVSGGSGDNLVGSGVKPTSDASSPMSYDIRNYSDLLTPTLSPSTTHRQPGRGVAAARAAPGKRTRSNPPVPLKRPGQFPPFALFSQEKRRALQIANPNFSFGDMGRRLGEMWHTLTESEKEDYRVRAKRIYEQKLQAWEKHQETLAAAQPQFVASPSPVAANRGAHLSPGYAGRLTSKGSPGAQVTARRRTHGYGIFSAERRKEYAAKGITAIQSAPMIADEWRTSSQQMRHSYEARATRMNKMGDARFSSPRPRAQQQTFPPQRVARPLHSPSRRVIPNLPSSTTLRISKVTSLSSSPKRTNGTPNLNLPSGISISRVEPEISIVSEQYQHSVPNAPHPAVRQTATVRQTASARRPLAAPNFAMGSRPTPRRNHPIAPRTHTAAPNPLAFQGNKIPSTKRYEAPNSEGMNATKRPRLNKPVTDYLGLGTPLPVKKIVSLTRYCRLCSEIYPKNGPLYTLEERPKLVERIRSVLGITIDVQKEASEACPKAVCRKCCHSLHSLEEFKAKVASGTDRINRLVTIKSQREDSLKGATSRDAQHSEDSLGVSILPDLDLEIDSVDHATPAGEASVDVAQPQRRKEEEQRSGIPTSCNVDVQTGIATDTPTKSNKGTHSPNDDFEDTAQRETQGLDVNDGRNDTVSAASASFTQPMGCQEDVDAEAKESSLHSNGRLGTISITAIESGADDADDPLNSSDEKHPNDCQVRPSDDDPFSFVQIDDCKAIEPFEDFREEEDTSLQGGTDMVGSVSTEQTSSPAHADGLEKEVDKDRDPFLLRTSCNATLDETTIESDQNTDVVATAQKGDESDSVPEDSNPDGRRTTECEKTILVSMSTPEQTDSSATFVAKSDQESGELLCSLPLKSSNPPHGSGSTCDPISNRQPVLNRLPASIEIVCAVRPDNALYEKRRQNQHVKTTD